MKHVILAHPALAKLNGDLGITSTIRAYLHVLLQSLPADAYESIGYDGLPFWPQLYLLIRIGEWKAAETMAERAQSTAFDLAEIAAAMRHRSSHPTETSLPTN